MAAPRRPREEEEEKEAEDASLEAKRPRGQRRLLVVLEGASLETVKVPVAGGQTGLGRAGPGRRRPREPLPTVSVLWP